MGGIRLYHVQRLHVHVKYQLDVSLDGEVVGRLPSDFSIVPHVLRVIGGPAR